MSDVTIAIPDDVLAALRARVIRTGRPESEVVEEALRRYLGLDGLLERIWANSPDDLTEEESLRLAYDELRAVEDVADPPAVTRDPKDDYLVALASAHAADALVSGDLDLVDATGLEVVVLTPRAFLDRLGDR